MILISKIHSEMQKETVVISKFYRQFLEYYNN
ncbi:hypothetical protein FHS70_001971 [Flammeovirga yaeyamensis]|nr:hypothetical protein [Flammeovirga yaeyamensis]